MDKKMTFDEFDLKRIFNALDFAANKHRYQLRKGADSAPYINHPIKVAQLLIQEGEVYDIDIIMGAILHDTIEDTETTKEELIENFGDKVTSYVLEMTDDKSLPKQERKKLQILNAPHKSIGAKQIKLCDKISNITDVSNNPPSWWDLQRRKEYLNWAEKVVEGLRGVNSKLEQIFDERIIKGRTVLNVQTNG